MKQHLINFINDRGGIWLGSVKGTSRRINAMQLIIPRLAAGIFSVLLVLMFTACTDRPEKNTNGGEQIDEPVLNSGPQTEAKRAVDATGDSAKNIDRSTDSAFVK